MHMYFHSPQDLPVKYTNDQIKSLHTRERKLERELIDRMYDLHAVVSFSDPALVQMNIEKKVILQNRTVFFEVKLRTRYS